METRQKIRFSVEEAVNYILEPDSDSELSELESDNDEYNIDSEDNILTKAMRESYEEDAHVNESSDHKIMKVSMPRNQRQMVDKQKRKKNNHDPTVGTVHNYLLLIPAFRGSLLVCHLKMLKLLLPCGI